MSIGRGGVQCTIGLLSDATRTFLRTKRIEFIRVNATQLKSVSSAYAAYGNCRYQQIKSRLHTDLFGVIRRNTATSVRVLNIPAGRVVITHEPSTTSLVHDGRVDYLFWQVATSISAVDRLAAEFFVGNRSLFHHQRLQSA